MTKHKTDRKHLVIVLSILCVLFFLYSMASSYVIGVTLSDKDYYQAQMLSFCEVNKVSFDLAVKLDPENYLHDLKTLELITEDCDMWLLEGDK